MAFFLGRGGYVVRAEHGVPGGTDGAVAFQNGAFVLRGLHRVHMRAEQQRGQRPAPAQNGIQISAAAADCFASAVLLHGKPKRKEAAREFIGHGTFAKGRAVDRSERKERPHQPFAVDLHNDCLRVICIFR
ncbi:hypothetical protein SDC9_171619 [bioreactor metagenome]|uniref:Uncharacterized protein n=1 Tax=bioreactor metagenome TaxID=1076179 RepID=A0A645GC47_9ZZZZ